MARIIAYLFFTLLFVQPLVSHSPSKEALESLSFTSTQTWKEFGSHKNATLNLDVEKTIWAGLITLRSKKALNIGSLALKWNGPRLPKLYASLYNRYKHKDFAPLTKNHVCDGYWNTQNQIITFPLKEKIVSKKCYYLVIGIKQTLEQPLRAGKFDILKPHLTTKA